MKKVGETPRPFRYDLNQIPYDYTVEVRNRFKGLNLIAEYLKNYGWRVMTLYRREGARQSPRKNMRKGKMVSEEASQITEERRDAQDEAPLICPPDENS